MSLALSHNNTLAQPKLKVTMQQFLCLLVQAKSIFCDALHKRSFNTLFVLFWCNVSKIEGSDSLDYI